MSIDRRSGVQRLLNVNNHDGHVVSAASFDRFHGDPVTRLLVADFSQGQRSC